MVINPLNDLYQKMTNLKYTEEEIKEKIRIEENSIREYHKDKTWSWGAPESDGEIYRMAVRNIKKDIFHEFLYEELVESLVNDDLFLKYPDGTPIKSKTIMGPGLSYCPYIPVALEKD